MFLNNHTTLLMSSTFLCLIITALDSSSPNTIILFLLLSHSLSSDSLCLSVFLQTLLPLSSQLYQLCRSVCHPPISSFSDIPAFFCMFVFKVFNLWFVFSTYSLHLSLMLLSSTAANVACSLHVLQPYCIFCFLACREIISSLQFICVSNTVPDFTSVTVQCLGVLIYKHSLACVTCVKIISLFPC